MGTVIAPGLQQLWGYLQILILPSELQGSEQGTYGCTALSPAGALWEQRALEPCAPIQLAAGEGWE